MLAPCCAVYPSVRRTGTAQWRALQVGPARVASVREQQPHSERLRARGEGPATRDSGRLGRWAGRLGQPLCACTQRTVRSVHWQTAAAVSAQTTARRVSEQAAGSGEGVSARQGSAVGIEVVPAVKTLPPQGT
jgi:hypothetical protein